MCGWCGWRWLVEKGRGGRPRGRGIGSFDVPLHSQKAPLPYVYHACSAFPVFLQVIYSSTPLWSAVFASLLIGSESLGTLGYVGGGLIIAGGLVSAIPPSFLGLKKASAEGEEEKGEA